MLTFYNFTKLPISFWPENRIRCKSKTKIKNRNWIQFTHFIWVHYYFESSTVVEKEEKQIKYYKKKRKRFMFCGMLNSFCIHSVWYYIIALLLRIVHETCSLHCIGVQLASHFFYSYVFDCLLSFYFVASFLHFDSHLDRASATTAAVSNKRVYSKTDCFL